MIEIRHLHKQYGAVAAASDVSFIAADGTITGLLGENGAGKTTTLGMMCGLIRPDAGSVRVDGDIATVSRHPVLRALVGPDAVGAVMAGVVERSDDAGLTRILRGTRTVAVLGAKPGVDQPAFYVPAYLAARGYRVLPVNPTLSGRSLFGTPVVATLADLAAPVDVIEVFRRPEFLPGHAREILSLPWRPGAVWFQLDPEGPDSDRAQRLTFFADYNGVPEAFSIELLDEDGEATLASRDGGEATGDTRYAFRAELARGSTADNWTRRYLRVWMNVRLNPRAFRAGWTTDLTVLHGKVVAPDREDGFAIDDEGPFEPLRLQCRRQTDAPDIFGVDDDHVRISIFLAGELKAGPTDLGGFDSHQIFSDVESRLGLVALRYLPDETVRLELLEADSGLRGDDDRLEGTAARLNAHDLRSPRDPLRRSVDLNEGGSCTICGKYRLDYNLSHGLQAFGRR